MVLVELDEGEDSVLVGVDSFLFSLFESFSLFDSVELFDSELAGAAEPFSVFGAPFSLRA